MLDTFIGSILNGDRNEEAKSISKKSQNELKNKNFKLLELQKRSLASLEKAFLSGTNMILAD